MFVRSSFFQLRHVFSEGAVAGSFFLHTRAHIMIYIPKQKDITWQNLWWTSKLGNNKILSIFRTIFWNMSLFRTSFIFPSPASVT